MTDLVVVPDGLVRSEDGLMLHPALGTWEKQLKRAAKSWAEAAPMTAFEWYGLISGCHAPMSQPLASRAALTDGVQQVWMATPYSAIVTHQTVRLMPSSLLDWHAQDAEWLADLISPLLEEEGISLHVVGCALLLACRQTIDALPQGYANIDGGRLPDRFPAGKDGGRLVRLMAEIQMVLAAQPSVRRQDAGKPPIHGLWFWAPGDWPVNVHAAWPPVVTPDTLLASLADGRDARFTVISVDHLNEGMARWRLTPRHWLLASVGHAVRLDPGGFPRFSRHPWRPTGLQSLTKLLRDMI
ncbi:MAG: hypothetical protein R8K46_00425 [Mariprofundaceae bacterium]